MTTSRRVTTAFAIALAGVFVLPVSPANAQSSVECGASTDTIKACADEIFTAQIDLLDQVERHQALAEARRTGDSAQATVAPVKGPRNLEPR